MKPISKDQAQTKTRKLIKGDFFAFKDKSKAQLLWNSCKQEFLT